MKRKTLKETQSYLFDLLKYSCRILENNNLNYSLAYGTLIGAARHKGFIPWDDDIDIVMPWNDYLKMLKLPELNIPDAKYTVHYSGNTKINKDEKYDFSFAKIENNYTKCIFKKSDEGGGAFLDVFPLTPLPLKEQREYAKKIGDLQTDLERLIIYKESHIKEFARKCLNPLYRVYRDKLIKESFRYTKGDYDFDELADTWWGRDVINQSVPKEWFDDYTQLEFNGEKFKVISNYKEWLRLGYGDWEKLPPKEEQVHHHYFDLYDLEH